MNAIKLYRLERWFYLHKMLLFAKIIRGGEYSCYITALSPTRVISARERPLDIREWGL